MEGSHGGNEGRWSVERARAWGAERPWLVGCNFIPSTAVNQLEMWQAETWDPTTVERELGWAAELGFNCVRVYLHDLLWEQDSAGFVQRIDAFLEIAQRNGIGAIFVLFDDVWCVEAKLGPQPPPYPGRHNSGWVQSPGLGVLHAYPDDPAIRARLEAYVRGVVSRFSEDGRVLVWDLYNEPGGFPNPGAEAVDAACLPLLRDVFAWARAASPRQPLTSGLWWNPLVAISPAIAELQSAHSDIVSFHHYGPAEDLEGLCERLRGETDRPLLCTEYLARHLKSSFETHLPIFRERGIGAVNWGLVSGKTQTIHPWWSWFDATPASEPDPWFHDILQPDGSPFDVAETDFLRRFLAIGNGNP